MKELRREQMMGRVNEAGRDWRERKETLESELEQKVNMAQEFIEFVKNIPPDSSAKEVGINLDKQFEVLLNKLPEKSKNELERYLAAGKEIAKLESELHAYDAGDLYDLLDDDTSDFSEKANSVPTTEEDQLVWQKKQDELDRLYEIKKDQSWAHLLGIYNIINNLKLKAQYVESVKTSKKDPKDILQPVREMDIKIEAVEFDAVNIYIYTHDELAVEEGCDTFGVHFGETPISIIKISNHTEATRLHESIHNIVDGSELRTTNPVRKLEMLRDTSKRVQQLQALGILFEDKRTPSAREFLDGIKEELLAEIRNTEKKGFWNDATSLKEFFSTLRHDESEWGHKRMRTISNRIATAGVHIQTVVKELREMGEAELSERIVSAFISSMEHAKKALTTASKISEDAHEFVHAALTVLQPSQYRHVHKLLKNKFGEDVVQSAENLYDVTQNFRGRLDDLRDLEYLAITKKLPKHEADKIREIFLAFKKDPDRMNEEDFKELRRFELSEYIHLMHRLSEHGVIDSPEELSEVIDRVIFCVFSSKIDRSIKESDGRVDLANLTSKEKNQIANLVEIAIMEGFAFVDYEDEYGQELTWDALVESNFWQYVQAAGSEARIKFLFEKYVGKYQGTE